MKRQQGFLYLATISIAILGSGGICSNDLIPYVMISTQYAAEPTCSFHDCDASNRGERRNHGVSSSALSGGTDDS